MSRDDFDRLSERPGPPLEAPIRSDRRRRATGSISTNPQDPPPWQALPRWTRCSDACTDASFAAGGALFALDQIVRADPVWLGAFRMRQALIAAAASARLLRRREDEAALRDVHHLPSDDPGPAGRLHRVWRGFAARPTRLDRAAVDRLAENLGLNPRSTTNLLARIEAAKGSPVAAAAAVAHAVADVTPDLAEGDVLGLMLADMVVAAQLGWTYPLPLLATAIIGLRTGPDGRRPQPGDHGWAVACQTAYARAAADAHHRMGQMRRRAERLMAVAGNVRTRGGGAGILALLGDDAVAASALKGLGSERAARRFLARLVELGAIRELTGRTTFRLYGL